MIIKRTPRSLALSQTTIYFHWLLVVGVYLVPTSKALLPKSLSRQCIESVGSRTTHNHCDVNDINGVRNLERKEDHYDDYYYYYDYQSAHFFLG